MSKIWDALRKAEQDKNQSAGVPGTEKQDPAPERRSTKCVLANALVSVYGYGNTKNPFYEQAEAISASAGGGVMILAASVNPGQILFITNEASLKEEKCVVREVSVDGCGARVVFEFLRPDADFWDSTQL